MTNLKKLTACGAALALVAVGSLAFAQDDLDDMLKDLEGEIGAEEATTAEAKAEEPVSSVSSISSRRVWA